MDEAQPQNTQLIQYREITAVHLKTEIYDEELEDSRKSFSLEDKHVENVEAVDGMVLVDFDNQEGHSFPFEDVHYLDYIIREEEVPVPQKQQQPRGNQSRGNPRGGRR